MSITTEAAIIKTAMMRRRIGTIAELADRAGVMAGTVVGVTAWAVTRKK